MSGPQILVVHMGDRTIFVNGPISATNLYTRIRYETAVFSQPTDKLLLLERGAPIKPEQEFVGEHTLTAHFVPAMAFSSPKEHRD